MKCIWMWRRRVRRTCCPISRRWRAWGLTVHFRLPVLDRIEKACCDETSAVRISRELSRCAGGNVVTMGTVELKLRDQVLKRTMDIVGGIVGCIISIPIIALVAIPLKLESPGPLIFKQRPGWAGMDGCSTSTSCAACMWTRRHAKRS